MLSVLLSAALAAAPVVASPGLASSGPRGSATATLALERALARTGVSVVQPVVHAQRAALEACAQDAAACRLEQAPGVPVAVLVGALAAGPDGGVVLEAELRATADGRALERVRASAGGVPDLSLLLGDARLSERLARALGQRWSPEVERNPDWVYPGAVGLGVAAAGAILVAKARGRASRVEDYARGETQRAFADQRAAASSARLGAAVVGGGSAVMAASALAWWLLPVRTHEQVPGQASAGVLTLSGEF